MTVILFFICVYLVSALFDLPWLAGVADAMLVLILLAFAAVLISAFS